MTLRADRAPPASDPPLTFSLISSCAEAMKTVCAALVLVMLCSLQTTTVAQVISRPADCCLTYYPHAIPLKSIVSYSIIDNNSCELKAVVFNTKKGKKICGNPAHSWVKHHVAEMDKMQYTTKNTTLRQTTA
ncbi:C-C motif chemokine 18-like [Arapaima gigas]